MREGNRQTLIDAIEHGKILTPDIMTHIITCMIRYDLEYMMDEYPEYILQYPELVEHTINKNKGE